MSVASSDLVPYHSATQSDQDGVTVGGAIDTLRRPDFTQMTANDTIQAVSSNAGDTTQTVTVTARNAAGSVVTSSATTLTGTTAVAISGLGTVERILKVELSATAAGNVTIRSTTGPGTNFSRVINAGERGFSALIRQGSSSTGGTVTYYAKFFWRNANATNALLGAAVTETADPTGLVDFGLAASQGDSGTTTNRQTAPGGVTFASTSANVPGTDLAASTGIGVWVRLALATNNAAIRSTWSSQIAGSTT